MAAALALHLLGYAMQQTRVSLGALLVFSWGCFRFAGGLRWSRAAFFPLLFLLLAIPVGFLQPLGFYLRLAVSASAAFFVQALGAEVVRNGTQLSDPHGLYHYDVAAACSGVRSLVALFALSVLIGYVRLVRWRDRAVLMLATLPLAFFGNFLRILAIVMIGRIFGQGAGEKIHDFSGFLVFSVVLGGLLFATRWFPENKPRLSGPITPASSDALDQSPDTPRSTYAGRWTATAAVLLGIGAVSLVARQFDLRPPEATAGVLLAVNGVDPAPLPEFIGTDWIGQRVEVTPAEREVLPPDTGYSRRNYVSIQDRARQVFLSIVLTGRDRSSIHRPELCLLGQGWNLVSRTETTLTIGPGETLPVTLLRVEREVIGRAGERQAVSCWLVYWFVGRTATVASHAEMLWRSSLDRLLHFRADRWAYVVAQTPVMAGQTTDLRTIEEVLTDVWPRLKGTPGKLLPER